MNFLSILNKPDSSLTRCLLLFGHAGRTPAPGTGEFQVQAEREHKDMTSFLFTANYNFFYLAVRGLGVVYFASVLVLM